MIHYHYIIQGFALYEKDGTLADVATIDVLANNEKEALVLASKRVAKKHYRVASVVCHNPEIEGVK